MKKIIAIIACLLMVTMLFVACDNNDNNNDDGSDAVSSDIAADQPKMDGGEEFANDNEAIYKDSWN